MTSLAYQDKTCGTCAHRVANGECRESPPNINDRESRVVTRYPFVTEDTPACSYHLGNLSFEALRDDVA